MITDKDINKMNDYDKVILECQLRLRNQHEKDVVYSAHLENSSIDEAEKRKRYEENMRFLMLEDTEKKRWIYYDSKTESMGDIPFGEITASIIDEIINLSPNSKHHKKLLEVYKKLGIERKSEDMHHQYKNVKKPLKRLLDTMYSLSYWKSVVPVDELKIAMFNAWKEYRYMNFLGLWEHYADEHFITEESVKSDRVLGKLNKTHEDIKSFVDTCHESAAELAESMHNIINESFLIYIDNMGICDNENKFRIGRSFVTPDITYIFCWDLYHILVSWIADTPHFCPRCCQLFYSNNNKSKYCPDCKKDSSTIRSENRKKSVRYYHKKVYDKINQSSKYDNDFKNAFLSESNYYWDRVCKKEVPENPSFSEKIETEQQYQEWLEKKLNSL